MAALVFLSALLLYANAIGHDYALDDWMYTTGNASVNQGFSAFADLWTKGSFPGLNGPNDTNYRPLALFSFMVETQIFGLNPHISHLINVLLFALSCVLIYVLLTRLLPTLNRAFPLLMVLLFVFHPVHVEAVANIKGRDDLLCLFFGIVSLLQIHRYARTLQAASYWSSVLAFAACALSKESGVTFLLVIPLALYFFTSIEFTRIVKITIPYLAVAFLYLVVLKSVLGTLTIARLPVMDNALMAATSTSDMLATNFVLLGKYVHLLVVPYPLSWDYWYNQIPIVLFANVWAIAGLSVSRPRCLRRRAGEVERRIRLCDSLLPGHPVDLVEPVRQNRGHVRGTLALHTVAWVLHCPPSPDCEAAGHRPRGKNSK